MLTLYDFAHMTIEEKRRWEISHSSLARLKNATYDECRAYACQSISDGMTKVSVKKGEIVEIPYGVPFNFIGRVDTTHAINTYSNNRELNDYYKSYTERTFISYSTISNRNVSHYFGRLFFLYDICPEDIVHIFPMDSNTEKYAVTESELTWLPSLWSTLQELNELSTKLGVYNQVTCKTKRNGQIIKPYAVAAFEGINDSLIQRVANLFEIGTIILHPDKDAVFYENDLLYDWYTLRDVSEVIEKLYGFSVASLYYED